MALKDREPVRLRIALVPLGDLEAAILSKLREDLTGIFAGEIEIYPAIPLRERHLVKERGQYLADGLIGDLSAVVTEPGTIPLGITAADLFSPGMNFVFGIAGEGKALVSVFRLRPEFRGEAIDPGIFRRRVFTEAVHELGHALGLSHCEYPGCVMYFSNWIGDTDRKGPGFCYRCARTLERQVSAGS